MHIKDILVVVDEYSDRKSRIMAAADLASRHDAHLTGLFCVEDIVKPIVFGGAEIASVYAEIEKIRLDTAARLEQEFNELTNNWRAKTSWIVSYGATGSVIARHAAWHDIVVTGKYTQGSENGAYNSTVDRIVLASSRPVLVLPSDYSDSMDASRILIAWNGSPESVRAIHGSLGFLQNASAVEIIAINEPHGVDMPCIDMIRHLTRHGVKIDGGGADTKSKNTGETILGLAKSYAADMLVMGAYGHSRLAEYFLGGATRHMLSHTHIPILMSH